jgi:hypothetical protein
MRREGIGEFRRDAIIEEDVIVRGCGACVGGGGDEVDKGGTGGR